MRKIFLLSLIFLFSLQFVFFDNFSYAHAQDEGEETTAEERVDSFDLFWPVVAGRTMGDSLYFLKTLKENIKEMLVFSNFKKADFNIILSTKRLVEAEKLLVDKKDNINAKKSLDASQEKRDKAFEYIKKAESEGRYVVDLKTTLGGVLEKQRALLHFLSTQVSEDSKKLIEDNVSTLNETLAKVLE